MKLLRLSHFVAGLFGMLLIGCEPEEEMTSQSSFDRLVSVPPERASPPSNFPPHKETVSENESTTSRIHVTGISPEGNLSPPAVLTEAKPIDEAVRTGTAQRAGPITPEKFVRWKVHEEMKIELEIQGGRVRHQKRALSIIKGREVQFLNDIDRELRVSGASIEARLKTFERLKSKYSDLLHLAQARATEMSEELLTWELRYLNQKPFHPFESEDAMKEKLNEIVSSAQAQVLAGHGIRDARAFALMFWRQRDQLADLLGIELAEASRLVDVAATQLPKKEIEELEKMADRIRKIPPGVPSPDGKEEEP
ncbi:MAG: hypothetical protein O3B13_22220 [Planctomycetota bacterium]|nr:hypothetical protein [Planctomycetota bacterium]